MAAMVVEVVEVLEVVVDVYMVVGHRAVDFCRFWEPHCAGEVLLIFLKITDFCSLFCREEPIRSSPAPSRSACTASARHSFDSPPPR